MSAIVFFHSYELSNAWFPNIFSSSCHCALCRRYFSSIPSFWSPGKSVSLVATYSKFFLQLFKILHRHSIGCSRLFLLQKPNFRFSNETFCWTFFSWMIFLHAYEYRIATERVLCYQIICTMLLGTNSTCIGDCFKNERKVWTFFN